MSKKAKVVIEPVKGQHYMITGEHPHAGATAKFLGVKHATGLNRDGYLFRNVNTEETFFVFSGADITNPTHEKHT